MMHISQDRLIVQLIQDECRRQENSINLIASENYASPQVLQALGSCLMNKYAEGYPHKRYYSGCAIVDTIEEHAQERVKQLFGAQHANVQPHAGSSANFAVYSACLKPGDTILGMSLSEGGHLTHGHPVNMSGILYKAVQYSVDPETHLLDYDAIEKLAQHHKPKLIIAGASAYSRTIDFEKFATIAHSVNALLLADIAHIAGLVAAGLHPTPVPYADFVSSTTHKTLRGPRGAFVLCKQQHAQAVDRAILPGTQGGPFMHAIAAKAVGFYEALQPEFRTYQHQVINNARYMAQKFQELEYRIITNGTDNHLFIIDLRNKGITGKAAEAALEQAGITVSRSCIPFDPEKPSLTSGIRLGTPAITTRGMKEKEIEEIVHYCDEAIRASTEARKLATIQEKIMKLCQQFPIYPS